MFDTLISALHQLYDVKSLIEWGGLFLVCAIVFVETGLLIGFFLPGDSLLFTAGVFAAAGYLPLGWLLFAATACAIVGNMVGYFVGRHVGKRLFNRKDSLLFKRKYVEQAEQFFKDHGSKTIILARFVPIVRTFATVVAGTANMPYGKFVGYSIIGGILWVWGLVLAGYGLSSLIPNIEQYLHWVILVIIILSILPVVFHYFKAKR